jgi:hypothetical protein
MENISLMTKRFETDVRKWLRHFYAAGFDSLVTRLDKCINVDGGYVEK